MLKLIDTLGLHRNKANDDTIAYAIGTTIGLSLYYFFFII